MNRTTATRIAFVVVCAGGLLALQGLAGCRSSHRVRAESDGKATVCRSCYDKAVEVWESGRYGGTRWGYVPTPRVSVEHQCRECGTTAVVHTDDGKWMITCPTCAPAGVACDKCQPPEGVVGGAGGGASRP